MLKNKLIFSLFLTLISAAIFAAYEYKNISFGHFSSIKANKSQRGKIPGFLENKEIVITYDNNHNEISRTLNTNPPQVTTIVYDVRNRPKEWVDGNGNKLECALFCPQISQLEMLKIKLIFLMFINFEVYKMSYIISLCLIS